MKLIRFALFPILIFAAACDRTTVSPAVSVDIRKKFQGHWETAAYDGLVKPLHGVVDLKVDILPINSGLGGRYNTPFPPYGRETRQFKALTVVDDNTIEFEVAQPTLEKKLEFLNSEEANKKLSRSRFRLVWVSENQLLAYRSYHYSNDEKPEILHRK